MIGGINLKARKLHWQDLRPSSWDLGGKPCCSREGRNQSQCPKPTMDPRLYIYPQSRERHLAMSNDPCTELPSSGMMPWALAFATTRFSTTSSSSSHRRRSRVSALTTPERVVLIAPPLGFLRPVIELCRGVVDVVFHPWKHHVGIGKVLQVVA